MGVSQTNAAVSGIGLVVLPIFVGSEARALLRVLPEVVIYRPIWLSVTKDQSGLASIRSAVEIITELFSADQSYYAKIGAHEAMAATPEDAATAVYAEVTGQDIAEIPKNNPGFLEMKDTKRYIYRVLDWLADNAQSNDGQLQFRRSDLNRVVLR
jgi:hypothetical protein